jgi:hypothetical protein
MLKRLSLFAMLVAVSCAAPAPTAPPATPIVVAATRAPAVTSAPTPATRDPACAATYAPPSATEFRSDDPAKLTASAKPKLVEFFAYW